MDKPFNDDQVMNRLPRNAFHSINVLFLVLNTFLTNAQENKANQGKGLKDYYNDFFSIGVAVSPRALRTDEAKLVLSQFNSVTPENAMKMGPIHPQEANYNWAPADSIVAFAQANKLAAIPYAGTIKLRHGCLLIPPPAIR